MKFRQFVFFSFLLLLASCTNNQKTSHDHSHTVDVKTPTITEQEVTKAKIAWGEGIVKIGKAYTAKEDYKKVAEDHINKFYHYKGGSVLFKPTLASDIQFRPTFEGALSYFIGHSDKFPEDKGFAIKPWSDVRWENQGIQIIGNMAIAMGNYYFTPAKGGDPVKVEYSFAYTKDKNGDLKIILHGSHLPYSK